MLLVVNNSCAASPTSWEKVTVTGGEKILSKSGDHFDVFQDTRLSVGKSNV